LRRTPNCKYSTWQGRLETSPAVDRQFHKASGQYAVTALKLLFPANYAAERIHVIWYPGRRGDPVDGPFARGERANIPVHEGNHFEMSWRWVVWLLYVAVWTWGLLLPNPDRWARALILPVTIVAPEDHPVRQELLEVVLSLFFSKTLHVAGYALLAVLSGWQRTAWGLRWGLLVFMSIHALGTEFLQAFAPGRHPSWRDVGLDHVGIMVGLALTWKWWLSLSAGRPNPS